MAALVAVGDVTPYAKYQVQTTGCVYVQPKQELWVVAVRKAAGAAAPRRRN